MTVNAQRLGFEDLQDLYLSSHNDFITHQGFADYFDIPLEDATRLINAGRLLHEFRVERLSEVPEMAF